jgi:hypothetical protein
MKTLGPRSNFIAVACLIALLALTASVLSGQDSAKIKPLPTVQHVMNHYVSALGGHDAIFKHKSMTVRGTFEVDKQPAFERIAYYKGDKMLYQINLPNGTPYQEGFNGTVAWQLDPSGHPTPS